MLPPGILSAAWSSGGIPITVPGGAPGGRLSPYASVKAFSRSAQISSHHSGSATGIWFSGFSVTVLSSVSVAVGRLALHGLGAHVEAHRGVLLRRELLARVDRPLEPARTPLADERGRGHVLVGGAHDDEDPDARA